MHRVLNLAPSLLGRQRQQVVLGNRVPTTAPDTWLAPDAVIIGDVDLFDRVRARRPQLRACTPAAVCDRGTLLGRAANVPFISGARKLRNRGQRTVSEGPVDAEAHHMPTCRRI